MAHMVVNIKGPVKVVNQMEMEMKLWTTWARRKWFGHPEEYSEKFRRKSRTKGSGSELGRNSDKFGRIFSEPLMKRKYIRFF